MLTIRGLTPTMLARLATTRRPTLDKPVCAFVCVADHFEPKWRQAGADLAMERVDRWVREYPRLAQSFADCRGCPPQHTFFYPLEEYEPHLLEALAKICRQGFGDVEVHLHHDRDTSAALRENLERFTSELRDVHGLLGTDSSGRVTYGFIHGNWALDNSRSDGRWCGVNDEITVLRETGCYADFTMPSAPAPCQTSTINSIYYAIDDPLRPKSHDRGIIASAGERPPPHSLLLIQGPLALDWKNRKCGLLPRLENGELTALRPPTLARLGNWLAASVHVSGRPDWRFIKLHTHGAQESNSAMLLGEPMREFHRALAQLARQNQWFRYYYVTARQMAALVHALEADPELRDPAAMLEATPGRTAAESLPARESHACLRPVAL